jgi:hypothetical protein
MTADFELTSDDLVAFVTFCNNRSPTAQRQRIGCAILGFLAVSALPALILLTTARPRLETAFDIWPLLLGPVLFVLFLRPFFRWSFRRNLRRMFAEGESKGYFGPCSLSIAAEGVVETKSSGESIRKWAAISRIVVTSQHVFIYSSALEAFILPKRAFDDDGDCQEFVRHVTEHASVVPETAGVAR